MGIGGYNAEGYADPTAYYAVQNVEEQEKILHIRYSTGHMDIRMEVFFPATVDRAKKLFRLVRQYSSEKDKQRIWNCLSDKEKKYKSQIQTFMKKMEEATTKREKSYWYSRRREAGHLLLRTQRNMEIFQKMTGAEEGQV